MPEDPNTPVPDPRTLSDSSPLESDPPSPKRPQLEIRKSGKHFELVGLISTFAVFFITCGTATLILGWLYAFHDPIAAGGGITSAFRHGSFVIKEPSSSANEESLPSQTRTETLRILMFSSLASHLVSLTSTILVTLLAYRSAIQWLRSPESPDDANLTPIQYGLLVRTLGSGSLMSILNTLRYTSLSTRAKAPRLFKEAVVGVTGIYILSHTVGVIDLWLHGKARSLSVFRGVPVESEGLYGIAYNQTTCGPFNMTGLPCHNLISNRRGGTHWAYDEPWMYLEGFDTISGVNPNISLEYISDTAILVPGPNKSFESQGFSINTQGLRVECANLRDECDRIQSPFPALIRSAAPVTNCSKAGYPRVPYYTSGELKFSGWDDRNIESLVLGIIGDEMGGMLHGTADFSSGWTANPVTTIVQLRWENATFVMNSGDRVVEDNPGVWYGNALDLYAKCTMTYLDVIAQYDPTGNQWTIKETALSRPELASILWTPMIFQLWTDDLRYALTSYITIQGAQTMDTLKLLMAKYGIAYTAPLMEFTAASNFTTPQPVALGLYPMAPTLLLVCCLYIYSLVALVIFLLSCKSNNLRVFVPRELTIKMEQGKEKSALDVAQLWLTDPLPLVGSMFPGGDGKDIARSVKSDPLQRVYDSLEGLGQVGIGLYTGHKGDKIFGLIPQSHNQQRRHRHVSVFRREGSTLLDMVPIRGSTGIALPQSVPRKDSIACNQAPGIVSQSLSIELEPVHESSRLSDPHRPQLGIRTSQRRVSTFGLVSSVCVFAMTGGIATLMIGWLCAFRDNVEGGGGALFVLRNGSFVITEPAKIEDSLPPQTQTEALRILMFSALAGHLVSVASTILVTLLAYRVATKWLRASESGNPNDVNLSPLQYGLLVRTLGSGSLMSIYNSLRYIMRSGRAKSPGFFKEALVGVAGIYLLTHVVGLVDLWLHASVRAVSVVRPIPVETQALYGISYSDIKCGAFNKNELPCQKLIEIEGGTIYWAYNYQLLHLQFNSALSDTNPYSKLKYINDTAILVPGPGTDYRSRSFAFNTHGIRARCSNVRDQCERLAVPVTQFLIPGGSPVINCSEAGYPDFPYYTSGELRASGFDGRNIETLTLGIIGNEMGGMINGTGDFSSLGWTPNPATIILQLRWPNVTTHDTDQTNPGVAYLNALDLYATCSVEYLDVVAEYDSMEDEWRILETTLSSPELASVFWTPLMFQWGGTDILQALKPYMTNRGTRVLENLEMVLAKTNMGYISPLMTFIPAANVTTARSVALGLYPAAPTILLMSCLYIFSLVALAMLFFIYTSNNRMIHVPRHLTREKKRDEETSALDIAQTWLTDPLPFIGSLFPTRDGGEIARSIESDPLRQVSDGDRGLEGLRLGLHKWRRDVILGLVRRSRRPDRNGGKAMQEDISVPGEAAIISSRAEMGEAES